MTLIYLSNLQLPSYFDGDLTAFINASQLNNALNRWFYVQILCIDYCMFNQNTHYLWDFWSKIGINLQIEITVTGLGFLYSDGDFAFFGSICYFECFIHYTHTKFWQFCCGNNWFFWLWFFCFHAVTWWIFD